ncbi:MAG: DUF3305 domain-containing protein [Burkholderiaceae bacterium]|nr:DUF3305 domain-containing protein [Burkholderiaceae bacterium]MEB2349887.1 DUF3305 domain-containing protein [Burkholderiaceae bacterium]
MEQRDFRPPGAEPLIEVDPVPVRVVFERRETGSPWQPVIWRPGAIEPAAAGSPLAVRLSVDETEGYYLNLTTGQPSVFVLWRMPSDDSGVIVEGDPTPPRALAVTASYNEAGRWMDGGERVDPVPMPAPMQSWVAEYTTLHYVPEKGRKRRGNRPSFMGRGEFEAMAERERAIHAPKPGTPIAVAGAAPAGVAPGDARHGASPDRSDAGES